MQFLAKASRVMIPVLILYNFLFFSGVIIIIWLVFCVFISNSVPSSLPVE